MSIGADRLTVGRDSFPPGFRFGTATSATQIEGTGFGGAGPSHYYERAHGYEKHVGLVHVDFQSLKRTPKTSYHAFAEMLARQRAA